MPKKILIIKSSSMGDIVHALPVAYDIKKHYPDCELSWVVEESFTDIPKLSPFVDKLVVTAFRRWRKNISHRQSEVKSWLYDAHWLKPSMTLSLICKD